MRFAVTTFAICLSALLGQPTAKQAPEFYKETLYPSHACPEGRSWSYVDADSNSVTVACYESEDQEQPDPDW